MDNLNEGSSFRSVFSFLYVLMNVPVILKYQGFLSGYPFYSFLCSSFFSNFHFQSFGLLSPTPSAAHWPFACLWSCLALTNSNQRLRIPALRSEVSMLGYVSSNCVSFCFSDFISRLPHFSTSIILTFLFRQKMAVTAMSNRRAPRITQWVLFLAGSTYGSGMTNTAVLFSSGPNLRKVQ